MLRQRTPFTIANFILGVISTINILIVVHGFDYQHGVTMTNQIIAWTISGQIWRALEPQAEFLMIIYLFSP